MNNNTCPICGHNHTTIWTKTKDLEYVTSEDEYTYHECLNCNTIFLEEFPMSKLDKIYPPNYYSFLTQKRNLALSIKEYLDKIYFSKVLKKFRGKQINILDVGGGSGWLADIIKKIHPNVNISQIVDIDKNAKIIAQKNGHKFFHGPIEKFNTEHKFDLVLMLNLIEHISNPKETLIKIEKLLNSNGVIIIKTPNINSLDARLYKDKYWGGLHCPRHWILFSQNSFRTMIKNTDLIIDKIKYTQGAPFWAWSILIAWQKRGWTKITKERPVMFHPLIPILHMTFAAFDFIRLFFGFKASQMLIELKKENTV